MGLELYFVLLFIYVTVEIAWLTENIGENNLQFQKLNKDAQQENLSVVSDFMPSTGNKTDLEEVVEEKIHDIEKYIDDEEKEKKKKKFVVRVEEANWYEAWPKCTRAGMQLASILSKEEQDEVEGLMKKIPSFNDNAWIGGQNLVSQTLENNGQNKYVWVANGEYLTYNNWYTVTNEPNNINNSEHCTEIMPYNNYTWNDSLCHIVSHAFVCEYY